MDAIILDSIRKSFGDVKAVDFLSARVPEGCIYGFLGPNGAGKTTAIRMMMNIIYPDSGTIEILGDSSPRDVRRQIGYLPEERGLYRKMKVGATLSYLGRLKGLSQRDTGRQLDLWLDRLGISSWADKKIEELSRGMQQKIQFVATVINDPEILILDEPFTGLDPVNLEILRDIIIEFKNRGRTVIFSTHMMDQAEKLCDCILLINKGKKVIDGSMADIRSSNRTNSVLLEVDGETGFISELPFVCDISENGRKIEVALAESASSQELLEVLLNRVHVRSFEEKVPSLHDIFVEKVGRGNE